MALASFGGVLGVLLALLASALLARLLAVPFILDPAVVAIAFAFSAGVGMVFGYFPARRAARLDPIEALRYDWRPGPARVSILDQRGDSVL